MTLDRLNQIICDLQFAVASNQGQLREAKQWIVDLENKIHKFQGSAHDVNPNVLGSTKDYDELFTILLSELRRHEELKAIQQTLADQHQDLEARHRALVTQHQDLTLAKNQAVNSVQRLEREKAKLEKDVKIRDKMLAHLQQRVAGLLVKSKRAVCVDQ